MFQNLRFLIKYFVYWKLWILGLFETFLEIFVHCVVGIGQYASEEPWGTKIPPRFLQENDGDSWPVQTR